ncbi:MAG: NADH-quinone oxidoreductase subunit N [Sandaracinaceae bacterium]|nr:NADH-quinone oxidoreductase subunit N [Sandaracinaceae bacterium]
MTGTWLLVGPLLFVAVGGLAMMLADAFVKQKAELAILTTVILFAAGGLSLGLWIAGPPEPAQGLIGSYLAYDRLALFLDLVICGGGALAALLAGGYLREHSLERGEFYVLLLFSAFGAMALGRAVDLLSAFVGIETMSLGVYGLVAFRRHSPRAAEGALKYFLLGSFASAILLFGMSLLYGATGETGLVRIAAAIPEAPPILLVLAMLLLSVGLAFKISAVPFHTWAPDAYEGAVTPATTFMAVVVKAAVFGLMIRVFFVAFGNESLANPDSGWPPALAGLAAVTLVVGNLAALVQKNVKRMLAYSSISHAGFILVGMVAAWKLRGTPGQEEGLSAVLYYLMAYTVSNVLAFGSLILMGSRGKEAVTYDDLAGVGRRHPMAAVPFVLGILSLMGFPPTAGFLAKYYVILAAVHGGDNLVWLAVLAVVMSAIGAYYYLRVLVVMFMKSPEEGAPVAVPMKSGYVVAALVLSGYFVIRMGVAPDSYLELAIEAAQHLLG